MNAANVSAPQHGRRWFSESFETHNSPKRFQLCRASASGHTGFEAPERGTLFFYQRTDTGVLWIIYTLSQDDGLAIGEDCVAASFRALRIEGLQLGPTRLPL